MDEKELCKQIWWWCARIEGIRDEGADFHEHAVLPRVDLTFTNGQKFSVLVYEHAKDALEAEKETTGQESELIKGVTQRLWPDCQKR